MLCFKECPYGDVHTIDVDAAGAEIGARIVCSKDEVMRKADETECPYFRYITQEEIDKPHPTLEPDMVNSPPHYTMGKVECIEAIESACGDGFECFLQGQVIKYVWRYRNKGREKEDLEKARWYLNRLIDIYSEKE